MARRRHFRRHHSKKPSIFNKAIMPVSFAAAFLSQITSKDHDPNTSQGQAFQNADLMGKLRLTANSVIGRITGITPFNDGPTYKQTINPAGVINKWTGIGIGGILATQFLPLPFKGKIRAASKGILLGAILGGLFDDPANLPPNPIQQIQNIRIQTGASFIGRTSQQDADVISASLEQGKTLRYI